MCCSFFDVNFDPIKYIVHSKVAWMHSRNFDPSPTTDNSTRLSCGRIMILWCVFIISFGLFIATRSLEINNFCFGVISTCSTTITICPIVLSACSNITVLVIFSVTVVITVFPIAVSKLFLTVAALSTITSTCSSNLTSCPSFPIWFRSSASSMKN